MVQEAAETAEIFAELVETLGLLVVEQGQPDAPDVVLLDYGGQQALVELERLSAITLAEVSRLLAREELRARPGTLHVLVADRIPEAARRELASHGWGWLDLRGHLHLAGPGLFVDANVPTLKDRSERMSAFSGRAGLEIACSLLLKPDVRRGIRELARDLARSPSTVSEVLGALRKQGLVDSNGLAVVPDLFWETASAWSPIEVALADLPRPGAGSVNSALQLGFDDVEAQTGWALTGTLASAAYGAPVATRADYPPDFYVPSNPTLRRAARLLGVAADSDRRMATVRLAPVPTICRQRIDPARKAGLEGWASAREHWPLANPLFVALDLARDPGRGREILDGWQPPPPWRKVW